VTGADPECQGLTFGITIRTYMERLFAGVFPIRTISLI
jgi:hypothetical protein